MPLLTYRATAKNDRGLRFNFRFQAPNWNGIKETAHVRLAEIVAADPLHVENGPWVIADIDRSA